MTQMRISGNYSGQTSLHIASQRGHWKFVEVLLKYGALLLSIDVRNNEGPHLTRGSVGEGHLHDVVQFRVSEQGKMCIMLVFTGLQ